MIIIVLLILPVAYQIYPFWGFLGERQATHRYLSESEFTEFENLQNIILI